MILYKYLSFESGKKALEANKIAFTQPQYFNDPFDMPIVDPSSPSQSEYGIFSGLNASIKSNTYCNNTGILPLTRLPTNLLMWSHYADSHQGLVLGIDARKAGFLCEKTNLIPAHYGNVSYSSIRPKIYTDGINGNKFSLGSTHHFSREYYHKLQNLFLTKPQCWAYEEEVRVVKCINGIGATQSINKSGEFKKVQLNDHKEVYLYSLSIDSIVEVYTGCRLDDNSFKIIDGLVKCSKLFKCKVDREEYNVRAELK